MDLQLPAHAEIQGDVVFLKLDKPAALTVAAVGRDISTWVQGQPQVVWTDNRNTNQNARQGFRAKPGVFGIQGHDPTTLIDIRSLRVLPLD